MSRKIVYVDMDNVLVDFRSALPLRAGRGAREYAGHLDDVPGIFSLMTPMPGALVAFSELATLFDTYILSTAPWDNPTAWSDKLTWVKVTSARPRTSGSSSRTTRISTAATSSSTTAPSTGRTSSRASTSTSAWRGSRTGLR